MPGKICINHSTLGYGNSSFLRYPENGSPRSPSPAKSCREGMCSFGVSSDDEDENTESHFRSKAKRNEEKEADVMVELSRISPESAPKAQCCRQGCSSVYFDASERCIVANFDSITRGHDYKEGEKVELLRVISECDTQAEKDCVSECSAEYYDADECSESSSHNGDERITEAELEDIESQDSIHDDRSRSSFQHDLSSDDVIDTSAAGASPIDEIGACPPDAEATNNPSSQADDNLDTPTKSSADGDEPKNEINNDSTEITTGASRIAVPDANDGDDDDENPEKSDYHVSYTESLLWQNDAFMSDDLDIEDISTLSESWSMSPDANDSTNGDNDDAASGSISSSQNPNRIDAADSEERERLRSILCSVEVDPSFLSSPAVAAVQGYFPRMFVGVMSLILLAARLFIAQTCRLPNAADILTILDEASFEESEIVDNFARLVKTCGGSENLPYFKARPYRNRNVVINDEADSPYPQTPGTLSPQNHPEVHSSRHFSNIPAQTVTDVRPSFPNFGSPHEQHYETSIPKSKHVSSQKTCPSRKREAETPLDNTEQNCTEKRTSHSPWNGLSQSREETNTDNDSFLLKLLEKEYQCLQASMMCVLCKKSKAEITFLPCGHFITCSACSEPLFKCPRCFKDILAEAKTYLA